MRLFKKTMAVALASAMTIGMAGVASADCRKVSRTGFRPPFLPTRV